MLTMQYHVLSTPKVHCHLVYEDDSSTYHPREVYGVHEPLRPLPPQDQGTMASMLTKIQSLTSLSWGAAFLRGGDLPILVAASSSRMAVNFGKHGFDIHHLLTHRGIDISALRFVNFSARACLCGCELLVWQTVWKDSQVMTHLVGVCAPHTGPARVLIDTFVPYRLSGAMLTAREIKLVVEDGSVCKRLPRTQSCG
eukprot:gnl/Dysnectes_brevis/7584_a12847_267.p1 GENE.gnl/Dysnectes_brevis/7584_a12847_267~~gnl/Dysnectes_brevis/7584_a12847_267.p1  ORF type:complete len:197 (+),score=44.40 gnl/Dysnectes_brevis/7584_a12847_267:338-928(+)